jgi:alkylated DNA repair dioxygenase AlkB
MPPRDIVRPEGLLYVPDFLTGGEEEQLIEEFRRLEFREFSMHGVVAKRRVLHFGLLYGYESWKLTEGPPIPDYLVPIRERCAGLAGVEPEQLPEALLTEYRTGAGIGWHRDAPMFGTVVGLSLAGTCRMRFQRGKGGDRQTAEVLLEPRSAYVLSGPARTEWQHSIPATKELRYSITFRTLRERNRKPKSV